MSLKKYEKKRTFPFSPEPRGKMKKSSGLPQFVVQKHSASHLHYDLRLEYKGALLSWAVPKGFSLNPSEKHLAAKVEDHPLEYMDFEGIIPEGNYGAGTVMVWDKGYYIADGPDKNPETNLEKGLSKGNFSFHIAGKKLKGGFVLAKLKNSDKDWLLFKKKDQYAKEQSEFDQNSVLSGRSMEEIAGQVDRMPYKIRPMMAFTAKEPFDREGWIFEVKWDGYRAIAEVEKGNVNLYSRNLKSFNKKFESVVQSLSNIGKDVVLDGEIVIIDEKGKSNFQALQDYGRSRSGRLVYYVFDLLYFNGQDLRKKPLIERKFMLQEVISKIPLVKYSGHIETEGKEFFSAASEAGVEGIVAKDMQSHYMEGRRSRSWLKIKKENTAEAIIVGYTLPQSGRKYFSSLIMGAYDEKNELIYIGNVGTGFDDRKLKDLIKIFSKIKQDSSPFKIAPKLRDSVWLEPILVCSVKYAEWTNEGVLRQPVFLGLRDDINPSEVKKDEQFKIIES